MGNIKITQEDNTCPVEFESSYDFRALWLGKASPDYLCPLQAMLWTKAFEGTALVP
jgi:hypothetical protein